MSTLSFLTCARFAAIAWYVMIIMTASVNMFIIVISEKIPASDTIESPTSIDDMTPKRPVPSIPTLSSPV